MTTKDLKKRMAAYREKTADNIMRTGRSIVGVFPDKRSRDPTNDAFSYSIGNALKRLPELLIVGMYDDTYVINTLSEMMIARGRKFDDGEMVSTGGLCSVCVVDASEEVKDRYTIQAGQWFGGDYEVMQVVLPDRDGRFPWERGCAAPYSAVKVWRRQKLN